MLMSDPVYGWIFGGVESLDGGVSYCSDFLLESLLDAFEAQSEKCSSEAESERFDGVYAS